MNDKKKTSIYSSVNIDNLKNVKKKPQAQNGKTYEIVQPNLETKKRTNSIKRIEQNSNKIIPSNDNKTKTIRTISKRPVNGNKKVFVLSTIKTTSSYANDNNRYSNQYKKKAEGSQQPKQQNKIQLINKEISGDKTKEKIVNDKENKEKIKQEKTNVSNNTVKVEKDSTIENVNYYLNSFKPYYCVDIKDNFIQVSILLYQANNSSIEKATIIDKSDYYEILIKGTKNKPKEINGETNNNIEYGTFIIQSEIEKKVKNITDKKSFIPDIKVGEDGYMIITFTQK